MARPADPTSSGPGASVTWRRGGTPELPLALDRDSREPLGRQLQDKLRTAIRSGQLTDGERMPASRTLAEQLEVSRGVVVDAYAQLESEGYLRPIRGAGTVVAYAGGDPAADSTPPPTAPKPEIDFEYGVPDQRSFPMSDWMWAVGVAGRAATATDLGDETGLGSPRLCEVLASYLRRVRSVDARAEAIAVCAGFRYGLNLVLRAVAQHGVATVALEDPGPLGHADIARRSGMRVVHVPVDEAGLDVAALRRTEARAVVVTPAHQSPTGVVLAPERRHDLIAWANEVDGYVLEDDYDAEFRYDRQPVGALQGLAPDRVLAMGSTSKTLTPGLRLGWIVCPSRLRSALSAEKELLGRGAPGLDQLALAALIESGRYDKHLRQMRVMYGRRRAALVDAIAQHAPGVTVTGLAAGCHAVLALPDGVSEQDAIAACAERSVAVYGMSRYRSTDATDPAALVIGFGNVNERTIAAAFERIGSHLAAREVVR